MSTKRTLDTHYTDKIQEYEYYNKELVAARDKFAILDPSHEEYNELKKRIDELEERCEEEIDYYTNTASILFNYYNIVENNIEEPVVNNVKDINKGILKYFVKHTSNIEETKDEEAKKHVAPKDKATLLEEYIAFTSSNYVKTMNPDALGGAGTDKDSCGACGACGHCGSMNRVTMVTDSIICCYDCHSVEHIIVDHDKPSYKESPREISYYSYRRINHLNESTIIIDILIFWLK